MQTDNIKRPALIEPFFNLEIDFKNDYVEYISSTNQNAVTPQSNITKNLNQKRFEQLKKFNVVEKNNNSNFIKSSISDYQYVRNCERLIRVYNYLNGLGHSHKNLRSDTMAAQNKSIEILQKSKTKFDIAFALDCLIPNRHFKLLVDQFSKSDLVFIKDEFIRNHKMTCQA